MFSLLDAANKYYDMLPLYLRYQADEDPESGLEPEELKDAWGETALDYHEARRASMES